MSEVQKVNLRRSDYRHGEHNLKSWSTNQAVIGLSSGEAEYYALVKGVSGAIGITNLCKDLGTNMEGPIRAKTDASAAIGIANRIGVGKVRHIEVNQLWLQEKVYDGKIEIIKVKTENYLADVLTKAVDGNNLSTQKILMHGRRKLGMSSCQSWTRENRRRNERMRRSS